jgi:large conductance mechanosensitive channel
MGFVEEFKTFLKNYQVLGLAVAFIIGAAATKLVTAVVKDVVMPIVAVLVPGGDWQASMLVLGPLSFPIGDLVGNLIDFIIVAGVVFMIVKFVMREDATAKR